VKETISNRFVAMTFAIGAVISGVVTAVATAKAAARSIPPYACWNNGITSGSSGFPIMQIDSAWQAYNRSTTTTAVLVCPIVNDSGTFDVTSTSTHVYVSGYCNASGGVVGTYFATWHGGNGGVTAFSGASLCSSAGTFENDINSGVSWSGASQNDYFLFESEYLKQISGSSNVLFGYRIVY
jgi:hypothetical protein